MSNDDMQHFQFSYQTFITNNFINNSIFKCLLKLNYLNKQFLFCSWKDLQNPFRKDPRCNLVFLPTILRWKGAQRLDGERASSADLVEMLFEDED